MSIEQQMLQQVRSNQQMMNNPTVANVFNLVDKGDTQGLLNLYLQTCQTTGNKPDPNIIRC